MVTAPQGWFRSCGRCLFRGSPLAPETAERARAAAARAERDLASSADLVPLHGIPMGITDIIDTAGVVTACDSATRAGRVPSRDADVVTRPAG